MASLIFFVRAAIAVSSVSESMIGKFGSTPSRMWSHTQSESKPSSSILTPYSTSALRVRHFRIGGEVAGGDAEGVVQDRSLHVSPVERVRTVKR